MTCDNCVSCEVCHAVKLASKMDNADVLCEHFVDKDLINRQKAEIERLEKLDKLAERSIDASKAVIKELRSEIAILTDANTNLQDLYQAEKSNVSKKQKKLITAYRKLQTAKAEAVKEFAERLKESKYQSSDWSHGEHPYVVEVSDIDNLVEEMAGASDG